MYGPLVRTYEDEIGYRCCCDKSGDITRVGYEDVRELVFRDRGEIESTCSVSSGLNEETFHKLHVC